MLVDAGDGISKALLMRGIPFNSINGVLLTHLHADHYSGLASLIVQMKMNKRKNRLDIYIHKDIEKVIRNFIFQSYLFEERLNFELNFVAVKENIFAAVCNGFEIMFRQNSHLNKYEKYDHKKKLKFPCGSFLFRIGDENIFYTGDIGAKKDLYLFDDFKLSTVISEAAHVKLKDILKFYDTNKPQKLLLTHLNDEDISGSLIPKESRRKMICAYDGLEV